jgi:thymidylate synthase ThyX
MTYEAKVIEDSIGPNGIRLTTMQLTYPRYIHAEFMTHRAFSRNASSSRAIPSNKLIENSLRDMVLPIRWGLNQPGMQASNDLLSHEDQAKAESIWKTMATQCAEGVKALTDLGVHKQWSNRPLEWFGNITVVVTATDWDNFFELRNHEMAQPEIHHLAILMLDAMNTSYPKTLIDTAWHLPYVSQEERKIYPTDTLLKISTARCARVSYLTQEGTIPSVDKDIALYERLVGSVPLHASPCEHQAMACTSMQVPNSGNFRGWVQHRKLLERDFE